MGNLFSSNQIPIDSYLDQHACSGRNITWQYIHNHGVLPLQYQNCPYADDILFGHCCWSGECHPINWIGHSDKEFQHYQDWNWDGLGDPHVGRPPKAEMATVVVTPTLAPTDSQKNGSLASGNETAKAGREGKVRRKRVGCIGVEASNFPFKRPTHWPPLGVDGKPMSISKNKDLTRVSAHY